MTTASSVDTILGDGEGHRKDHIQAETERQSHIEELRRLYSEIKTTCREGYTAGSLHGSVHTMSKQVVSQYNGESQKIDITVFNRQNSHTHTWEPYSIVVSPQSTEYPSLRFDIAEGGLPKYPAIKYMLQPSEVATHQDISRLADLIRYRETG